MGLHIRRGIGGTCPAKAAARRPALQALLKGLLGSCPAGPGPAPPANTPSVSSLTAAAEAPASRSHEDSINTAAATPPTCRVETPSPKPIASSPTVIDVVPGATQAPAVMATSPLPTTFQAAPPTGASPGPTAGPQAPPSIGTSHGLPPIAATATNETSVTQTTAVKALTPIATNDASATAPTGIQALISSATNDASAAPMAHIQVLTPASTADAATEADLTTHSGAKARGLNVPMPCSKPLSPLAPTTGAVPATVRGPISCLQTSPGSQSTGMCAVSSVGRTATGVSVETSGVTVRPSLSAAVSQTVKQQTDSCSAQAGPTPSCKAVTDCPPTGIAAVVGLLSPCQSEGVGRDKLLAAEAMSTQTDTREVDCASYGKEEEEQKAESARLGLVIVTRVAACA